MAKPQFNIFPVSNDDSFIRSNKIEYSHHEVFLDEEIGEPSQYRELLSLLFNASENDKFTLFINTPGGALNSTLAIIEGIKNTQADVAGVLMGDTHSGGSFIAMYCHGLAVLDSAEMMIHTATFGSGGFTGNVKAHTDFTVTQVEKLIDDAYEGFLSPEEMVDVKKGVEIWLGADQIRERIERRAAILNKRAEEQEKADELEQEKVLAPKPKRGRPAKKT